MAEINGSAPETPGSFFQAAQQTAAANPDLAPVTPPPAPPAAAPVEAAPAQGSLDYARSIGLDVTNIHNERELIDHLANHARYAEQYRELAAFGQQVQPYAQDFQEFLQSRAGQQQAQQPAQPQQEEWSLDGHFKKAWSAPEFDGKWANVLELDQDTGQYVSKTTSAGFPLAHPEVVKKANEYAEWYRGVPREFFQNPYQKTYEAIKDPLVREVRQIVSEIIQQQQAQQTIGQFEQQHAKELYQHDQTGRPVIHPITGQMQPTEFGARFYQHASALKQSGLNDQMKLVDQAWRAAYYDVALAQQQQQPPQPVQLQVVAQPAPTAMSSWHATQPAQPNPQAARAANQESFLSAAMNRAQYNPSQGGYSAPDAGEPFTPRGWRDLEGFFERAARKQGINP